MTDRYDGHGEPRDEALGEELRAMDLPEHGASFWAAVERGIGDEAGRRRQEEAAAQRDAQPDPRLGVALARLPLPDHGPEYWDEIVAAIGFEAAIAARPRQRRWTRIVAAAAVAAAATFLFAAWFGLPESISGGVGRALAHVFLPPIEKSISPAEIDGQVLVWTSRGAVYAGTDQYDTNIFAYDLTRREPLAIPAFASPKKLAAAADGKIVWFDGRDGTSTIHVYDVRARRETIIGSSASARPATFADTQPLVAKGQAAVSGNVVVWTDWQRGNGDIWSFDLATGLPSPVCQGPDAQQQPAISGDTVVWADGRNAITSHTDHFLNGFDLYSENLKTGQELPLSLAAGDQIAPSISGSLVVWQDGRDRSAAKPDDWNIYGFDLATRQEFIVSDAAGPQTNPVVANGIVVWVDGPTATGLSTIRGYDTRAQQYFTVSSDPGRYAFPSISGGTVIWCSLSGDGSQMAVYAATLAYHHARMEATPITP